MTEDNKIDYSPTGDDVDSFSQKVDRNLKQLFQLVNILHTSGTVSGLTEDDAVAGEMRANLADNGLYIRSADNKQWIRLGDMDKFLGITPEKIEALRNGGKLGTFYAGTEAEMNLKKSSELASNDIFFAIDSFRVYRWTGSAWQILISKQFEDILDYEKYCVSRKEVDYSGADKILRLDKNTGKANVDITGSPERIFNKEIDFQNLRNLHAIVYNAEKNKWVNLPVYIFTKENLTYTGEASTDSGAKIVAVGYDGKIHGDFTGNTDHIGNIEVSTDGLKNNYVLIYDEENNVFKPSSKITGDADEIAGIKIELDTTKIKNDDVLAYDISKDRFVLAPRDSLTGKNITTTGEKNKIVKVADDGYIYGKFQGAIAQLADVKLDIKNLKDGDVIVYHVSTNTFKNEPKNIIPTSGTGASLILRDRAKVIGDYNGSKTVDVDISKVVSRSGTVSYVNHSMRLIENLYLALDYNNMNYGGRDGLIAEFFKNPSENNIDKTSVNVLSIVIGDDSVDVDSIDGLKIGSWYLLIDGNQVEEVQIKEIKVVGGIKRLIFEKLVTKFFNPGATKLCRSTATFGDGFITGDNAIFTTQHFQFDYEIDRAHLTVKHENIPDTEIIAEISTQHDAKFVKKEIIGIGDGTTQTVKLANDFRVSSYGFNLYFDGVKQSSGFIFSPTDAQVTFNAGNNVVVQADYIYSFNAEEWIPMYRARTYADTLNSERATTQFHFAADIYHTGKITALRLKLKQKSGKVTNELIGVGNDKPQGFKLPHHAVAGSISVSPSTATWIYKEDLDTVIINAPDLENIKITYDWQGRPFKIDSFVVIFNE